MSSKLFVGNLSFNLTENDLQDAFAAHGTVLEANLMLDRSTGRPRGFGFVTMSTPEEAQGAINALHGKDLGGRALTVNLARPRKSGRRAADGVRSRVAAVAADVATDINWSSQDSGGSGFRASVVLQAASFLAGNTGGGLALNRPVHHS